MSARERPSSSGEWELEDNDVDIGAFAPGTAVPEGDTAPAEHAAERERFRRTAPEASAPTRRTAQLNLSVKPETRERFWEGSERHGFTCGEEYLLACIEAYESGRHS